MSSPFQPIELYGHQAICVCSRGIPETIKILIYAKWVQGPPMAPFRLSAERRRLQLDNWRSGFIEELYVRDWAGHIETARDCKRTLNWRWGPGGSNHIWAKGVSSKWLFKPGARGPPTPHRSCELWSRESASPQWPFRGQCEEEVPNLTSC